MAAKSYLNVIPDGKKRSDEIEMRDLYDKVIPKYASRWEELGYKLGLEVHHIDNISANCVGHQDRVKRCCTAMLKKWLEKTTSHTWGQLDDAINHLVTGKPPKGTEVDNSGSDISTAVVSERLTTRYIQTRFTADDDEWPPDQPKEYTVLTLIHHKNKFTQRQILELAKVKSKGRISKIISATSSLLSSEESISENDEFLNECFQESRSTQNIADITAPLEDPDSDSRIVLIEGAPGLGKTVLLKQIAYEWASKKLLFKSKLVFLLPLRDPAMRNMSSVKDLVCYFCRESFKDCAASIEDTNGMGITFLLDGYDEYPVELQKRSFIADIINHNVLRLSAVVISSRPYATIELRKNITCYVDILGFTEEHQQSFFEKSLESLPDKLQELKIYVENHPTISSLCYAPFNMSVLVWLFKEGIAVPNSLAELYNCFICNTIYRHLKQRDKLTLDNITSLQSFPSPYSEVIQQISAFCLEKMVTNQLVFSLDEIKNFCPLINSVPGAINCFGLLQVTSHYSDGIGTPTKTVNFVHFSIQEFFAAYQIICLPENEEYEFIRANFFSEFYSNTIALYVGITKGQRDSFKQFLSDFDSLYYKVTNTFSWLFSLSNFESENRRNLRLFQCFNEANDKEVCSAMAKKLCSNRRIEHRNTTLLHSDVHCMTVLLSYLPSKSLKTLDLYGCCIRDSGLHILQMSLIRNKFVVNQLDLRDNLLTSKSMHAVAEIVIFCKVTVLYVSNNSLEDGEWLEQITGVSSTLERLYIGGNNLSCRGAIRLFNSLRRNMNTRLKVLSLQHNSITDEAVSEIVTFLNNDTTLKLLDLYSNKISVASRKLLIKSSKMCIIRFKPILLDLLHKQL